MKTISFLHNPNLFCLQLLVNLSGSGADSEKFLLYFTDKVESIRAGATPVPLPLLWPVFSFFTQPELLETVSHLRYEILTLLI